MMVCIAAVQHAKLGLEDVPVKCLARVWHLWRKWEFASQTSKFRPAILPVTNRVLSAAARQVLG